MGTHPIFESDFDCLTQRIMSLEDTKVLKDFTTEVDEKVPAAHKLAENDYQQAVESLLPLEKNCRVNHDAVSLSRVLVAIVEICFNKKAWKDLNENIAALTKRRSLIKMSIAKMVQRCCEFVEELSKDPSLKETYIGLMECLRLNTDGKIYVENERARLTLRLALLKEKNGDLEGASNIINELHVETYGTMDRKEKVEFILEQMRLTIANKDMVRAQIISKKISTRYFQKEAEDVQKLKLKYYNLMIELDMNEKKYLNVSKHFKQINSTPIVTNDPKKAGESFISCLIFCLLSEISPEQQTHLNLLNKDKQLDDLPQYKTLTTSFLTPELMNWKQIEDQYTAELRNNVAIVFAKSDDGNKRWTSLHDRVIEHNIRVVSKAYTRIRTLRLAEHLDLSVDQAEKHLADLVVKGAVWARIDRLAGTINFERKEKPAEKLNEWSSTVDNLMDLLNKATHCIQKEEMIHSLKV